MSWDHVYYKATCKNCGKKGKKGSRSNQAMIGIDLKHPGKGFNRLQILQGLAISLDGKRLLKTNTQDANAEVPLSR